MIGEHMSNFKKGDLVEIIGSVSFPQFIGERFTLENNSSKACNKSTGEIEDVFVWYSPFRKASINRTIAFQEKHLKKINPDTDKKSNFTFEELMDKIKSEQLEGVE